MARSRTRPVGSLGLTAAICLSAASPAHAGPKAWDHASSIGRDVLLGAALGVPAVQGDWTGDLQAAGSIGLAAGSSWALKEIFPEERPDHSDRKSFPSGHASQSFAAAVMLEKRYGWQVGLPALALASFVGASRVEARKHHWYDTAAGAALGAGSAWLITSRRSDRVRLVPWAGSGGGGLALAGSF